MFSKHSNTRDILSITQIQEVYCRLQKYKRVSSNLYKHKRVTFDYPDTNGLLLRIGKPILFFTLRPRERFCQCPVALLKCKCITVCLIFITETYTAYIFDGFLDSALVYAPHLISISYPLQMNRQIDIRHKKLYAYDASNYLICEVIRLRHLRLSDARSYTITIPQIIRRTKLYAYDASDYQTYEVTRLRYLRLSDT